MVPAIRLEDDKPAMVNLRWGLIPFLADDLKKLPLLINAQSETAATKPPFLAAPLPMGAVGLSFPHIHGRRMLDGKPQPGCARE